MQSFEYQVCSVQYGRVTFANGIWQGTTPLGGENALESCPNVWDYLRRAGPDGWELVSVTSGMTPEQLVAWFKRPVQGG